MTESGKADQRARAGREATGWMIRLQDAPDDLGLRADFDRWLGASPVHAKAWEATQRLSQVIGAASTRAHRLADDAGSLVRRVHRRRWVAAKLPRRRMVKASAFAAAACVALVAAPDMLLHIRADAVAGAGEMKTVELADGSVVSLAPGSALASDFADGRRRIRLLRGDAFFDVAHDKARPFTVEAGDTTTTVLGTAFEIRRQKAGASVAVRRGRVRVGCTAGPDAELLTAGQSVDFGCAIPAHRRLIDPSRVAAWTDGQFVASDQPLRDVVDAIRPWYRGVIVTRGAGIDRLRVTGVYNLHDPQQALGAVAAAHKASVRTITPWIIVISAN